MVGRVGSWVGVVERYQYRGGQRGREGGELGEGGEGCDEGSVG